MSHPTLESYTIYLRTEVFENHHSMHRSLFASIPPVLTADSVSRIAIEVMGCDLGYIVRVVPALEDRLSRFVDKIDWEKCCNTPGGIEYLLSTLGISTDRYRTFPTTRPKNQEQYEQLCWHNVALACHGDTFTKPEDGVMSRATRITPEHPHPQWKFSVLEPIEHPFGYGVVQDGNLIASASVRRIMGVYDGNLWAMGVGVDPEWRKQGIGRLVSAAATQEVLDLGGVALWNTQADNTGSLRIARSLGYRKDYSHITISGYVVEEDITT